MRAVAPADWNGMRSKKSADLSLGVLLAVSVLVIDQVSKDVALSDGSPLVPRNPDYAFGMVGGSATALTLGAFVVLGAFLVVAYQLVARYEIPPFLPALVAGGTIGNMIDRIRLGSVTDFVATPWAIVNVADVAVTIGVLGIMFTIGTRAPRRRTPAPVRVS